MKKKLVFIASWRPRKKQSTTQDTEFLISCTKISQGSHKGQGISKLANWRISIQLRITNYELRTFNYELSITNYGELVSNFNLSLITHNS
jgi:hypothetical protein